MKSLVKQLLRPVYRCLITKPLLEYRFKHNPQKLATNVYKNVFGKEANLDNPQDLIEKIIWLQFNSDTSLWTLCADKYRVRNFVEERGYGDTLCKLYGRWDNARDIDFDMLPDKFVLKTNNSCGQIFIVKDKRKLNISKVRNRLNDWLRKGYGKEGGQMHYTRIEPCVIAEEYLETASNGSLVDYKIWCFNGHPECILVCFDRSVEVGNRHYCLSMFDRQWNNISDKALNKSGVHFSGIDLPKPANLDKMLDTASVLSKGFPEVRVDLYNINGRIVFGEMTFTTGYGSYNPSFYEYLGSKIILPSSIQ